MPSATLPPALEPAAPIKPTLNVLTYTDFIHPALQTATLKIPQQIYERYINHTQFSEQLKTWIAENEAKYYLNATKYTPGSARPANPDKPEPPKQVPAADLIDVKDVPSPVSHQTILPIKGCKQISLAIAGDLWLLNEHDEDQIIPQGTQLVSFYKGKWCNMDDSTETTIPFALANADSKIYITGGYTTVGELLVETKVSRRELLVGRPGVEPVRYHTRVDAPRQGRPDYFTLKVGQELGFTLSDLPAEDDGSQKK